MGVELRGIERRAVLRGLAGAALLPGAAAWCREAGPKADRILVLKAARTLQLFQADAVIGLYPVSLGSDPVRPKRRLGDGRTPEGRYAIDGRSAANPFHLALHISYPSARDVARARAAGVDPGGNICIHGLPEGYEDLDPPAFSVDWTRGCIAVSDRAIEEIWALVDDGTPIEIRA